MLDLQNISARRGFFDVHTPISACHELALTAKQRKAMYHEMRDFCLALRGEVWESLGRPNKKNLRNAHKLRAHFHRNADLVRLYFALGDRIHEIDNYGRKQP